MNLLPDEPKIQSFPCPNCGKYINNDMEVCKYCSVSITDDIRSNAIAAENVDRRKTYLGIEKRLMITGLVIAGIGLVNTVVPTVDFYLNYPWGRVPCLSAAAMLFGAATFLHGLRGYLRESRK